MNNHTEFDNIPEMGSVSGTDHASELQNTADMEKIFDQYSTKKPEDVDTGDRSGIAYYIILAMIALAGLTTIIYRMKTRES